MTLLVAAAALAAALAALRLELTCTAVSPARVEPALHRNFRRLLPSSGVTAALDVHRVFDDQYMLRMRLCKDMTHRTFHLHGPSIEHVAKDATDEINSFIRFA